MKEYRYCAGIASLVLICCCVSGNGRVLHVDNRDSVPYTASNDKLKHRIIRSLVRNHLITRQQQATCQLNIMEIDKYYFVEVWPDGNACGEMFGCRLKKTLLKPINPPVKKNSFHNNTPSESERAASPSRK